MPVSWGNSGLYGVPAFANAAAVTNRVHTVSVSPSHLQFPNFNNMSGSEVIGIIKAGKTVQAGGNPLWEEHNDGTEIGKRARLGVAV